MPEFNGSYDNAGHTITVNPTQMHELYTEAKTEAEGLIVNLEDIVRTITELPWVGDSQAVADGFNQRWASATRQVFGSEKSPTDGALQKFLIGVALAAQNYGVTEDEITEMFMKFGDALSSSSSSDGPAKHGDLREPPITLTF